MKRLLRIFLFAALLLPFTACVKENHQVRFRNYFRETITNVVIGSANIGTVPAGSTSGYKSINTGNFSISGQTQNSGPLTGSGTLSGKGKHKWTVTLSAQGTIAISEDK